MKNLFQRKISEKKEMKEIKNLNTLMEILNTTILNLQIQKKQRNSIGV